MTRLKGMGLAPIALEESAAATGLNMEINIPGFGAKNVSLKDLAIMSRQMATMIAA